MLRESLYLPPPQSNIVESGNQLAKLCFQKNAVALNAMNIFLN